MSTRRTFLKTGAAMGAITVLPFRASAAAHAGDTFPTDRGEIVIHPVSHASLWMETPAGVIYVDPVGEVADYEDAPDPDLILITHEHGDHFAPGLLAELSVGKTQMIANKAVYDMMPEDMKSMTQSMSNGDTTDALGMEIEAIPAYNTTEGRLEFHPEGRDNGYVLNVDGRRIYISGDTEGVPEMRALEDIDIAFVCMNLPFTMGAEQAADAVAEFAPAVVYPYHYRGRDNGTQDPQDFAQMLSDAGAEVEVKFGEWYPDGLG